MAHETLRATGSVTGKSTSRTEAFASDAAQRTCSIRQDINIVLTGSTEPLAELKSKMEGVWHRCVCHAVPVLGF